MGVQRRCLLYVVATSGGLRCFSRFPILFLKDRLELKTSSLSSRRWARTDGLHGQESLGGNIFQRWSSQNVNVTAKSCGFSCLFCLWHQWGEDRGGVFWEQDQRVIPESGTVSPSSFLISTLFHLVGQTILSQWTWGGLDPLLSAGNMAVNDRDRLWSLWDLPSKRSNK